MRNSFAVCWQPPVGGGKIPGGDCAPPARPERQVRPRWRRSRGRRCPRRSRRGGSDRRGLGSAMTMAARCRCAGAHCHTESLVNRTRTVCYFSTVRPRQSSRPSDNECFAAAAACHPQRRPPIAATAACIRFTSGVNSGSAVAQSDSTRSYHVRASSAKPSFAARSPRCFIIRGASR